MPAPYRDDYEALTTRLGALLEKLEAVRANATALRELERAEKDIEQEIEAVRQRLERCTANRRLPLLDQVSVASPCPAEWAGMVGDDRTRFCGQCSKSVHNISDMSREEAEAFLRGALGEEVCIRLYRRADGTVLTSDCSVGVKRKQRRRMVVAAVGGGLLSAGALLSQRGAAPFPGHGLEDGQLVMGEAALSIVTAPPAETQEPPPVKPGGHWVAGGMGAPSPRKQLEYQRQELNRLLGERAQTKGLEARRAIEAKIGDLQKQMKELEKRLKAQQKPCACEPGDPLCSCL